MGSNFFYLTQKVILQEVSVNNNFCEEDYSLSVSFSHLTLIQAGHSVYSCELILLKYNLVTKSCFAS